MSSTTHLRPLELLTARASASRLDGATWASLSLLLFASAYFITSLADVNLDAMTDIGLASVLPPRMLAAYALLPPAFCLALRSGRTWLVLAAVVITVMLLFGVAVLVEPTVRFSVSWRHAGIAQVIQSTGAVDPRIDAYFNWPGFFVLTAFLADVSGYANPIEIARWTPLVLELLYLPALLTIGKALTDDSRMLWGGVWLFYVSNWIGQDYFSPQGLAFLLYLCTLAVLLRWFQYDSRRSSRIPETLATLQSRLLSMASRLVGSKADLAPSAPPTSAGQRITLVLVVVLLFVAVVGTHQLTPIALLLSVTSLVLVRRCALRGLPALLAILLGTWLVYMSVAYLSGHASDVTGKIGAVNQNVGSNVSGRVKGSDGHLAVVYLRVAVTLVFWTLAMMGGLRRFRLGFVDRALVALAMAPFPLLLLQSYGGEVLLRVALFAMPFMALLAAALFFPTLAKGRSRGTLVIFGLVATFLLAGFVVTRYGNERMDYLSPREVAGVEALYRIAPPGSVLVAASNAVPWRYTGYANYKYKRLTGINRVKYQVVVVPADESTSIDIGTASSRLIVQQVAARMVAPNRSQRSYLIISRSQKADLDMFGPWRRNSLQHVEDVLRRSDRFQIVFDNGDATIFRLADPTSQPQ